MAHGTAPSAPTPAPTVALVTVHGMGFQQAPSDDGQIEGYADRLHLALHDALGTGLLGDDPNRLAHAQRGPVYVHSHWPPDSEGRNAGLGRLGTWGDRAARQVLPGDPFVAGNEPVAHVALVYSRLRDDERHVAALAEGLFKAGLNLDNYAAVGAVVREAVLDFWAMLRHPTPENSLPTPSLHVRRDIAQVDRARDTVRYEEDDDEDGLFGILRRIEADVTTYVARNDHRERVRFFLRDALLRLCYRDDVAGVVVNAHSQGTVAAFDAVRTLPPYAARKVRVFVTSGSPLRKYVTLFHWGDEATGISAMGAPRRWLNFWDDRDPVADPLAPPRSWRRGHRLAPVAAPTGTNGDAGNGSADGGLFLAILEELAKDITPVCVEDIPVDNVAHSSGGGLQAHNYWDNRAEVVSRLGAVLTEVLDLVRPADGPAATPPAARVYHPTADGASRLLTGGPMPTQG